MSLPWIVEFQAWLPFPIIGILGIACAALYYLHFQKECNILSMVFCILTFVLSMFLAILVPVDVFLVSSTKKTNGMHHDWVNNATLIKMEDAILFVYYVSYGFLLITIFIFLPFLYFFNAVPKDGEENHLTKNMTRGGKFTFASVVLLVLLFVVGAVLPKNNVYLFSTHLYHQFRYLNQYSYFQTVIEDGLMFAVNFLGIVGMICACIYTAFGMTILPINLIKGKPGEVEEKEQMNYSISELQNRIQGFSQLSDHQPLGPEDRRRLSHYSFRLSELQSRNDTMRHESFSSSVHCHRFRRCLQIFLGIFLISSAIFLVICLIVSNVNRLLSSGGIHTGYMFNRSVIINPLDYLLLLTHQAFPLDYILICLVSISFILCSLAGMQHMGIWFLWVQVHHLRYKRTKAQSLIFSTFILASVTLYSQVFIYSIAPQYTTYGTQMYKDPSTNMLSPCYAAAPADQCIITRLMTLHVGVMFHFWFIAVTYFWASWFFVLIFFISLVVSIMRKRKTIAQIMVRNNEEVDGSMEHLLHDSDDNC